MSITALMVIDMQNAFCSPQGSLRNPSDAVQRHHASAGNILRALTTARQAEAVVIYTRHVYRAGYPEMGKSSTTFHPEVMRNDGLLRGTWDASIIDSLAPQDDEIVIDKCRFDAFLATELDIILRARDVSHLVITGLSTNVCVESTVRSGAELGYDITVLGDATSASTEAAHELALKSMAYRYAEVISTEHFENHFSAKSRSE